MIEENFKDTVIDILVFTFNLKDIKRSERNSSKFAAYQGETILRMLLTLRLLFISGMGVNTSLGLIQLRDGSQHKFEVNRTPGWDASPKF